MNKLIKVSILALALTASLSASAMTKHQANQACDNVGILSDRYALYGAAKLKTVLVIIEDDDILPEYLKSIITDSYATGMRIGTSAIIKQRESIRSNAKDKCLVYLLR